MHNWWEQRLQIGVHIVGTEEFLDILRRAFPPPPVATRIVVTAVEGRTAMAPVIDHAAPLNLSATQKVTLSVSPVLANGDPAPGPHTWTTSDATVLPITAAADGLTAEVGTPQANGSGLITFTSPGVRQADIQITYTAPVEGAANLSAGLPVED